ncbi:Os11g0291800 [Oryza sativa Japonica Group]|uniref:Os11g0291800 protein n=2 Tax=Oryza sativa subsp. japonica TaxID=39947 RepID=C7J8I9_ORYSJ|nr:hypothetical protein LOC_Os11g18750 [Oryza sativa Japonica Group]ABA92919.1 hypothetical protein LOC_Os11g18750 [Oryza sativa Japonica Group]BAH95212.1 Os11g0291800 [Oryza sativa Japonica Group]|eukprot:NP_001176484.1 Os11g0291800 [Oryza sativa Japonica Group]
MRRRRRPGGSGMRPSDGGADAAASVCMCGCEGQATALLDRAMVARPSEGAVRSGSGGVLPCGGSSARPCDSEAAGGAAHDGAAGRGPGGAACGHGMARQTAGGGTPTIGIHRRLQVGDDGIHRKPQKRNEEDARNSFVQFNVEDARGF